MTLRDNWASKSAPPLRMQKGLAGQTPKLQENKDQDAVGQADIEPVLRYAHSPSLEITMLLALFCLGCLVCKMIVMSFLFAVTLPGVLNLAKISVRCRQANAFLSERFGQAKPFKSAWARVACCDPSLR